MHRAPDGSSNFDDRGAYEPFEGMKAPERFQYQGEVCMWYGGSGSSLKEVLWRPVDGNLKRQTKLKYL